MKNLFNFEILSILFVINQNDGLSRVFKDHSCPSSVNTRSLMSKFIASDLFFIGYFSSYLKANSKMHSIFQHGTCLCSAKAFATVRYVTRRTTRVVCIDCDHSYYKYGEIPKRHKINKNKIKNVNYYCAVL